MPLRTVGLPRRLRFAGLEHGSTRVLVLGDSRADLTGVNLFEAAATQEPEVYEETLEGVVAALPDAGSITLRIGDEKRRVRFPLKLIKQAQRPAKLRVLTSRYYDSVFKRDVYKHTLIG